MIWTRSIYSKSIIIRLVRVTVVFVVGLVVTCIFFAMTVSVVVTMRTMVAVVMKNFRVFPRMAFTGRAKERDNGK